MELIDRYVFAVSKNLPEKERQDVEKELRANIEDMLQENYDEKNIALVLGKMGDPAKLADEYKGTKRYLIGPSFYDLYIRVLKLVCGIVIAVAIVFGSISVLIELADTINLSTFIFTALERVIDGILSGLVGAATWVTLVFAILEKTGVGRDELIRSNHVWTIADLPTETANNSAKISRSEAVFSLIWRLLWVGIIARIYENQNVMTSLFNAQVLRHYLLIIIILMAASVLIGIMKLIYGRWNKVLALINVAYNAACAIATYRILLDSSLVNVVFKERIITLLKLEPSTFIEAWRMTLWSTVVIVIGICIFDSVSGFVKGYKVQK